MILVDTDILIDILRGKATTAEMLNQLRISDSLGTSIIVVMELMAGCRNKSEMACAEVLFSSFEVIPITESMSQRAVAILAKYRLGHGLQIPDALSAATALERGLPLLTRNRKHFSCIAELELTEHLIG
jgi:predicted nucleic acid-binding protein